MKYSESQMKAINHDKGPALVLAVPGSGKTTVLLARIKRLIDKGVNPNNILSMTFSKSQALDMEDRFMSKNKINTVHFSTIHSFTYGIIKSFHNSKVDLIESSNKYNKYNLVKQIYYQERHKHMNDEQLETFFSVSGYLKNTLMDYDDYKKTYGLAFTGFEKVYNKYEIFKRENNFIDFDDMLLLALEILQKNKYALEFLQNKFEYVQVDEGQDTSYIQLKIISLIAKNNNNLFIVADDDQSIYGFRGASSSELLSFKNNYPDANIYYMQENYRSTASITSVSNKLIINNKSRYNKIINPTREVGSIININKVKNTNSQISHILKMVKSDLEKNETVAILYRNNISAISFIDRINDIDFYIKDGKMAFYSNQIIKDVLNIIYFAIDPYDINLFEKIYYKLNLFIKKDFVKQIKYMSKRTSIIEKLKECEGMNEFFLDKIYLLDYHFSKLSDMNFEKSVKYIFYHMEYYEFLKEFSRRSTGSLIALNRIIDTIISISKGIENISDFNSKIDRLISKQRNHSFNKKNLTLSTIHGAKGLEFDNVYMIDLIEKEFPAQSTNSSIEGELLEEERRLFYVAMTRAKNNLSLFYPDKLHNLSVEKSRFIDEILNDNR